MNRVRLYLHRLFRRPAVTGPYRLYIRRIPTGATLDVSDYLIAMIETIADNPDLMDLMSEIEEDRKNAHAHKHDGWEPEALLVEQLCTALGYELPLYGPVVGQLADRLRAVAPAPAVAIPAQREAGAA
ncbi:hypothetical protein PV728_29710 [Streptomyces europaeiscabiei]|uniref:hypothetical protein n=1 Tax=Streptomyces europaeiscabiei TaxID=146819 RepID=UPI0029ADCDB8|nr:hypothetical protein [Streptomyces europaeiscabiei]MDX3634369.1 hypothetical protein [Streptomyces europaeiscabiei]MDX3651783.1 hypothetical protein [Streptomyces europaeiscabiei]